MELLRSEIGIVVKVATAVVGLLALAITTFFKSFSLYDQHWSRRHHKVLKDLRAAETNDTPFTCYLDEEIKLESFRIASGVRANRAKADFLIRLAALGHWNRYQIKQISKFVVTTPEEPCPTFRITGWDVAGARLALLSTVVLTAMGLVLGLGVMIKGADTHYGVFAGFGVEIAFVLAAALVLSSYTTYRIALKFEAYLRENPEILHEKRDEPSAEHFRPPASKVRID